MLPWNVEDLTFDATRFRGKVRLFPLPDLVMFPHVMQPLHVFESRYRELLNAALDSDGLIAMSVLENVRRRISLPERIIFVASGSAGGLGWVGRLKIHPPAEPGARATYLNLYSRFLNKTAAIRRFVGTWVCTLH